MTDTECSQLWKLITWTYKFSLLSALIIFRFPCNIHWNWQQLAGDWQRRLTLFVYWVRGFILNFKTVRKSMTDYSSNMQVWRINEHCNVHLWKNSSFFQWNSRKQKFNIFLSSPCNFKLFFIVILIGFISVTTPNPFIS